MQDAKFGGNSLWISFMLYVNESVDPGCVEWVKNLLQQYGCAHTSHRF